MTEPTSTAEDPDTAVLTAAPEGGPLPDPLAGYEDWPAWAHRRARRRTGDPLADGLAEVLGVGEPAGSPPEVVTTGRRRVDGLVVESLEWETGVGPTTRAWVVRPDTAEALPGALALHCHGDVKSVGAGQMVPLTDASGGAAGAAGATGTAARLQREYYGGRAPAAELARRGFVVLAHDAFCWGSRRFPLVQRTAKLAGTVAAVESLWREQGLEPDDDARYDAVASAHEDTVAKAAGLLGTSLAGMVVRDDLVALDVLAGLDGVDATRLGAFGFSGGGGRSALLAALDPRVTAHVVTCMMATFDSLVPHYIDAHSWLLNSPGLPRFSEWPDLLAPRDGRRTLVQYAERDALFPPAGMHAAHDRLLRLHGGAASYRGAFWDRPHVFDAGMQDEAFTFLGEALGGARRS